MQNSLNIFKTQLITMLTGTDPKISENGVKFVYH